MIDISSRLALSTVANYPGVTEVVIKDLNKMIKGLNKMTTKSSDNDKNGLELGDFLLIA